MSCWGRFERKPPPTAQLVAEVDSFLQGTVSSRQLDNLAMHVCSLQQCTRLIKACCESRIEQINAGPPSVLYAHQLHGWSRAS